jgi:hypothetical protein
MPPGARINAAAYFDILTRLRRAIQNKRKGMFSRDVCLLHDNARPHSAHVTTALLEKSSGVNWTIHRAVRTSHPEQVEITCFFTQRNLSRGKQLDDDEVQEEVMAWFKGQATDFYDSGIQKLVPRLNKCLDK